MHAPSPRVSSKTVTNATVHGNHWHHKIIPIEISIQMNKIYQIGTTKSASAPPKSPPPCDADGSIINYERRDDIEASIAPGDGSQRNESSTDLSSKRSRLRKQQKRPPQQQWSKMFFLFAIIAAAPQFLRLQALMSSREKDAADLLGP